MESLRLSSGWCVCMSLVFVLLKSDDGMDSSPLYWCCVRLGESACVWCICCLFPRACICLLMSSLVRFSFCDVSWFRFAVLVVD